MSRIPLFAGFDAGRAVVRHGDRCITQGEFVAQAQRLAARLPEAAYAINLCTDRYRFMLAFAATLLRGQTNLMPSSPAAPAIEAVRRQFPDSHAIGDDDVDIAPAVPATATPAIEAAHVAALLFTSGSTGTPQAHAKSWLTLSRIAAHLSHRLLDERPAAIVATVPAQHMYGLETTALMGFGGGCLVHGGRPFFPQDVVQALNEVEAPRALVTTPVHLRALVEAKVSLPPLRFVLSATAPLTPPLAAACEAAWNAPVLEIYGCTEAGSTATRRTLDGADWQPLAEMELREVDGVATVFAGHLPAPVPLQDLVEIAADGRFRLLGRSGDLLKVAGKRASLADLTQKLLAVPGVQDAVIFNAADGEAARLAALVVAPEVGETAILQALAQQVDAVFLPRPLRKVDRLPRNELGKLPRQRLLELIGTGR